MAGRREFRNRLHEQLARRTARDAFRDAATSDDIPVNVTCEPCEASFSGETEDAVREVLVEHYKTPEHRMAAQLPIHKQRRGS